MKTKINSLVSYILKYKHLKMMRKFSVVLALLVFTSSLIFTFSIKSDLFANNLHSTIFGNYYLSFYAAFSFILVWEVAAMIYTIPYSVSKSMGKQFEIMSLVILRYIFEHMGSFARISSLKHDYILVLEILVIIFGAILIFYLISIYYRIQPHIVISEDADQREDFVFMKKIIAVVLLIILVIFSFNEVFNMVAFITNGELDNAKLSHFFFKDMFTIMIYFDIAMVLITMWYSLRYAIIFRTSALTASTILLRLSFTNDIFLNVFLTVLAVGFAILVTLAYKRFEGVLVNKLEDKSKLMES